MDIMNSSLNHLNHPVICQYMSDYDINMYYEGLYMSDDLISSRVDLSSIQSSRRFKSPLRNKASFASG